MCNTILVETDFCTFTSEINLFKLSGSELLHWKPCIVSFSCSSVTWEAAGQFVVRLLTCCVMNLWCELDLRQYNCGVHVWLDCLE